MIQFGVIKNFLRRVHSYPIWLDHPAYLPPNLTSPTTTLPSNATSRFSTLSRNQPNLNSHAHYHRESTSLAPESRPSLMRAGSSLLSGDSSNASTSIVPTSIDTSTLPPSISASDRRTTGGGGGVRTLLLRMESGGGRSHEHQPHQEGQILLHGHGGKKILFPHSLPLLFDGKHHTDEICVKYAISRSHLELVLRELGSRFPPGARGPSVEGDNNGGKRGSEYGDRVVMLSV